MSQMQIRPPVTFLDSNGNPAVDFRVFISQPFTDPKDMSKQLSITDSASGEVVSNPFTITMDGYPKNADGQRVNPVVQEQNYAILFESIGGGQQYSHQNVTGDAFGVSAATTQMVDLALNSFQSALAADMTGNKFIFIQSEISGWEGTSEGPVNSYYAYFTGGSGSPGTGTFPLFFDAGGNEWEIADISDRPLVNEQKVDANIINTDANTAAIAAISKAYKLTVLTASDAAWLPDADTAVIEFTVIGAGGGAGSMDAFAIAGDGGASQPGAGGGGCIKYSAIVDPTYNIVIGLAGAGGLGTGLNSGADGGLSSVTSASLTLVANGGDGGSAADTLAGIRGTVSAIGGSATGGDINMAGSSVPPFANPENATPSVIPVTYISGSSFYGGGVRPIDSNNGINATTFGEGGGSTVDTSSSPGADGGDGFDGAVIIKEFF